MTSFTRRNLAAFSAVMEHRSYEQAGMRLGIGVQGIQYKYSIRKLDAFFNTPMFHTDRYGLLPSQKALQLHDRIPVILAWMKDNNTDTVRTTPPAPEKVQATPPEPEPEEALPDLDLEPETAPSSTPTLEQAIMHLTTRIDALITLLAKAQ